MCGRPKRLLSKPSTWQIKRRRQPMPRCPECKGEGGFVGYMEAEQDFYVCKRCDGTGFIEGDALVSPMTVPLSDPEPFDVKQEASERASEEELRRLEET